MQKPKIPFKQWWGYMWNGRRYDDENFKAWLKYHEDQKYLRDSKNLSALNINKTSIIPGRDNSFINQ